MVVEQLNPSGSQYRFNVKSDKDDRLVILVALSRNRDLNPGPLHYE